MASGSSPVVPFSSREDIIIDEYYAQQNDLVVGDTIPMLDRDWRVSGIVEPGKLARVMIPIDILQELTGSRQKLTVIYAKLDDPSHLPGTLDALKAKLPNYKVYSLEEFTSQFSVNSLPELKIFMGVVVGLAVLFGFLVVFLAMHSAVLERTREIGILKAVGASPTYIFRILALETAVLGGPGNRRRDTVQLRDPCADPDLHPSLDGPGHCAGVVADCRCCHPGRGLARCRLPGLEGRTAGYSGVLIV